MTLLRLAVSCCAFLLSAAPALAFRDVPSRTLLQDGASCTIQLTGGLDGLAGYTDLELAHNCQGGFNQTVKIGGELLDLYRNHGQRCLFSGDPVLLSPTEQWCFTMQDTGGFHIFSLLQVNGTELDISVGFSQREECHPSSDFNVACSWRVTVQPANVGGLPPFQVVQN